MFVRGATLQYFQLLLRERDKRGIAQPPYDLSDIFARWWKATLQELSDWRVEEFLDLATGLNALRRINDAIVYQNLAQAKYRIEKCPGIFR